MVYELSNGKIAIVGVWSTTEEKDEVREVHLKRGFTEDEEVVIVEPELFVFLAQEFLFHKRPPETASPDEEGETKNS